MGQQYSFYGSERRAEDEWHMALHEIPGGEAATQATTATIAAVCHGGVVLAVAIGALLYVFVRYVAG
jgi:hypothetical protein